MPAGAVNTSAAARASSTHAASCDSMVDSSHSRPRKGVARPSSIEDDSSRFSTGAGPATPASGASRSTVPMRCSLSVSPEKDAPRSTDVDPASSALPQSVWSAAATSAALSGRWAGSLWSMRATSASSASGTSGRSSLTRGAVERSTLVSTATR